MKCYKCGAEVSGGKMSCDNCGAMIFSNTAEGKEASNTKFSFPEVSQGDGIGLSAASMILGIVAIVFPFIFGNLLADKYEIMVTLMVVCTIIGMVFGIFSLSTNRKGRRMAIAGLSCGIIMLVFVTILLFTNLNDGFEVMDEYEKTIDEYEKTIDKYEDIIRAYQEYYK